MAKLRILVLAIPLVLAGAVWPGAAADPIGNRPPDADALRATAVALIDRLAAGEFAAAADMFERFPGGGTTADVLRDQWREAVGQAGPFRGRAAGAVQVRGTGTLVTVRCTFAKTARDAMFFCSPEGTPERLAFIPPPLEGPGLIRAGMGEVFQVARPGAAGTVTFPVPGPYRDQVPLAFRVEVTPPEALQGSKWIKRDDGLNWLCEVTVAPPKDKVLVRWEALVLVGGRPAAPLPPAAKPEVPKEAEPWLRASGCVQSDDPAIQAKAGELARGGADVGEYTRRVIRFTTLNPFRGRLMRSLDACDALRSGSTCTGRANLAAALLRAHGIPARTVAHLPTWCGPLFCHWLVEYWHPGAGWVWLEPTLDRPQPPPWTAVVVNVANPADEDHAFDWTQASGVAAGVPHFSARELGGELRPLFDLAEQRRWGAVNQATPELALRATDAELRELSAAARQSFADWAVPGRPAATDANRFARLLAAARGGDVRRLTEAVRQP